jgi:hypothetical protein
MAQTPLARLGLQRVPDPIAVGTRVTNGKPGSARVAGTVVAVDGETYTVQGRNGERATELRHNLLAFPST